MCVTLFASPLLEAIDCAAPSRKCAGQFGRAAGNEGREGFCGASRSGIGDREERMHPSVADDWRQAPFFLTGSLAFASFRAASSAWR